MSLADEGFEPIAGRECSPAAGGIDRQQDVVVAPFGIELAHHIGAVEQPERVGAEIHVVRDAVQRDHGNLNLREQDVRLVEQGEDAARVLARNDASPVGEPADEARHGAEQGIDLLQADAAGPAAGVCLAERGFAEGATHHRRLRHPDYFVQRILRAGRLLVARCGA